MVQLDRRPVVICIVFMIKIELIMQACMPNTGRRPPGGGHVPGAGLPRRLAPGAGPLSVRNASGAAYLSRCNKLSIVGTLILPTEASLLQLNYKIQD